MQAVHIMAAAAPAAAPPALPPVDEAAFAAFHARTAPALVGYLARASGQPALAEDLAQEAYLRFLGACRWQQGEAACRRFLFRIATNLLRDHFRRPRAAALDDVPDAAQAGDGGLDVGALAARWDAASALEPAWRRLAPRQRQLLWLAYVEGYTHREIAEITGLAAPSLRLLLFRARRRIARYLGKGEA